MNRIIPNINNTHNKPIALISDNTFTMEAILHICGNGFLHKAANLERKDFKHDKYKPLRLQQLF